MANDGGEANFKLAQGKFSYTDHCICFKCTTDSDTIVLFNFLQMNAEKITYEGFIGSGLKNIDRQYFYNLQVPLIDDTKKIAKLLFLLDTHLTNANGIYNGLIKTKQALLQQLFI